MSGLDTAHVFYDETYVTDNNVAVYLQKGPVEISFMTSKHWHVLLRFTQRLSDYRDYLMQTAAQLDGVTAVFTSTKKTKLNLPAFLLQYGRYCLLLLINNKLTSWILKWLIDFADFKPLQQITSPLVYRESSCDVNWSIGSALKRMKPS